MLIFGNIFWIVRRIAPVGPDVTRGGHSPPYSEVAKIDLPMPSVPVIRIVAIGQTFADIPTVPTLAISSGVTVMPIAMSFPAGAIDAAAALVALLVGLGVLVVKRAAIRQTTLIWAWWWTLAALVMWAGIELTAFFRLAETSLIGPLRLAAITLSFCPVVALLGAKRPQHLAWNFVVLSLWAIVALPAAENLLLHRGREVAMGDARGWFLWILILLGPINFVPTRFWLPALLLASGQIVALSPYLPALRREIVAESAAMGLMLAAGALGSAWFVAQRATRGASSYDRVWLDFRDSFGLLWGLRVQERIGAVAKQEKWGLELTWGGFRSSSSGESPRDIPATVEPGLRASFKGLLRRFVSNDSIEERLGGVGAKEESRP